MGDRGDDDRVIEALEAGGADNDDEVDMEVYGAQLGHGTAEGYAPLTLQTSRGDITCRSYGVAGAGGARSAAIFVGGVGGGFDSPALDLYGRLSRELPGEGIAALRIAYRHPIDLSECVLDVLAGLGYLAGEGVARFALVGHSLGGAVVIEAGTASDAVRQVVTLATQSYGADVVGDLPEDCGILLIHGTADAILPAACSEFIAQLAHPPRRLVLLEGAGHVLDEAADEVYREVHTALTTSLSPARS